MKTKQKSCTDRKVTIVGSSVNDYHWLVTAININTKDISLVEFFCLKSLSRMKYKSDRYYMFSKTVGVVTDKRDLCCSKYLFLTGVDCNLWASQ